MKVYKNYEEVNQDLKILKLQSHINKAKIKRSIHEIKEDFSPLSMVANVAGSVAKKAFVLKAVSKIVGLAKSKR